MVALHLFGRVVLAMVQAAQKSHAQRFVVPVGVVVAVVIRARVEKEAGQ